jgi:Family of unknown function (DUF6152)
MKSKLLVQLIVGVAFLAVCGPALAHHGSAAYSDKAVEFKQATVTKFMWASPHCLINFDAKDDKGEVQHWVIETGPSTNVYLLGWTKTSLAPGDVITVYLWPAKSGAHVGRLNKLVLADGTELHDTALGGNGAKAPYNPNADTNGSKDTR